MVKKESNAKYHASKPLSKSRLFKMSVSPEWFHYCESHPQPRTDSMIFGSALHKLVLEPRWFLREYAILPACDRRTKEGRTLYAEFAAKAKSKTIITSEMYEKALAMKEKICSDRMATALLNNGTPELSYYTVDEMTGVKWKCRPDMTRMLKTSGVIVDLKSCQCAETEAFMKQAIKLGYDLQAAMYKAGVEKETQIHHDFVFLAIETEPPYMINIMQADNFLIKRGQELFREYIGTYAECSKTGNWYGYNGFSGFINNLSLPSWMIKDYE